MLNRVMVPGWLCKGQDQVLDMGMSCHWLGSVFFYQSVGMMVSNEVHCFLSVDTIRFDIYVLLLT